MSKRNYSTLKWTVLFAIPLTIVSLIILAGFYPGIMTSDSLSQWYQIKDHDFGDWHPVIHTWFMMLILKVWYSPAAVALVQIILMSLVLGYGLALFKQYGVDKIKLIIISVIAAILPEIPVMTVCIWKDIIYVIFVTLLTILMIRIYFEGDSLLSQKGFCIALFIVTIGTMLFRHNGIIPGIMTLMLLFILLKKHRKRVFIIFSLALITQVIVTGPIYKLFNVEPGSKSETFCVLINSIGRTAKYQGNKISEADKAKMSEILPYEKWGQDYNEYTTDYIKFDKDFKREKINQDTIGFVGLWFSIFKSAPMETVKAYVQLSNLIWNPVSGFVNNNIAYPIDNNTLGIKSTKILGSISDKILNLYLRIRMHRSFWRPAIPMYLFFILMLFAFVKNRNIKLLLIMSPVVFNILSLVLTIPAQDFRYLFSNYTVLLITAPMLFIKGTKMREVENG
ncbi:DUF6020 family protein [Inconstantimicrobium mannanitabidum]|uniref:Uncharacterized protein n=1 Tax=Inconstantimicrobium mannanitabidum TaxID=1604901 RepID=A0ACB5RGA0_9CLOT|nr:DUF6020 family protein [Clostridium sp. TW13]GKX68078.1 hypothetical protein rsdtw13_33360 [Clostridium sp. TW13]